jgi:hypothetical protein
MYNNVFTTGSTESHNHVELMRKSGDVVYLGSQTLWNEV